MTRIIDKKTRTTLLAGLSLGLLTAGLHAAMVEGERGMPSPVAVATALQAHVGAEGVDVSALLRGQPTIENAAVLEALSDEGKLQALQDYVRSAETAENPALGHAAAGALRKAYEAAQGDARTRKAVDSARKRLGKKIDAGALNALFDNGGASGVETVEAEIVEEGARTPASGLARSARRQRRAKAEPPSGAELTVIGQLPDEIVQLSPEDEAEVQRVVGQLMTVNPRSAGEFREAVEMVTAWGQAQEDTLNKAGAQLDEKMSQGADVQNDVKQKIAGLLVEVEKHNPNSMSIWSPKDWLRSLSSYVPGARKAIIAQQSGNAVIDTIKENVVQTHGRIKDFNDAYWKTIEDTEAAAAEYERMIDKADRVVSELADRLESDPSLTPERRQLLADHVLLPLSQRLQDMREEQANNQATIIKGYQTRRNIDKLMSFLKRQETSIPRMLRQSLLESKSLDEQQNALALVKSLNTATAAVVLSNSERSRALSAEINKQARTAMIPASVWQKVLGNAIATDKNNRQEDARALSSTLQNIRMLRQINAQGREVAHQVMLGTQMRLSLTASQEGEKQALPEPGKE